ncbi:MAG: RNA-binding protein [Gammaproteobacteria bacterium]|nr:RNA-binding protein [Gammaproteobacteria bacterium]
MEKNTIYVSHLPVKISEDDFRTIFSPYGEIKDVGIPTESGRSMRNLGFGFVTFVSADSATQAVKTANGQEITICEETRKLNVKLADDSKKCHGRGGRW